MADKQINELVAASEVADADLLVIQQSGVAKKLTALILQGYIVGDLETDVEAIEGMIGDTEASTTASAAHPKGSVFIMNNTLYEATSDIAVGDTITVGTNCAETTISELLDVSPSVRTTVTLSSASWSSNVQTVTVAGVLADETKQLINIVPATASKAAYIEAGIEASTQAADTVTFTCMTTPSVNLTVYVTVTEVRDNA